MDLVKSQPEAQAYKIAETGPVDGLLQLTFLFARHPADAGGRLVSREVANHAEDASPTLDKAKLRSLVINFMAYATDAQGSQRQGVHWHTGDWNGPLTNLPDSYFRKGGAQGRTR